MMMSNVMRLDVISCLWRVLGILPKITKRQERGEPKATKEPKGRKVTANSVYGIEKFLALC